MADKTIEQELIALEKRYWQALREKDVEAALQLTDDPGIVDGGDRCCGDVDVGAP